jgi:murein DD-endopeptidase MepM/ murein hydrolase activator NlpD
MYAHLKQGSVRVKSGDRIVAGQVLGLLGNSGNTPEPHLHLQLMDRNSPLGGQGLPFTMREFTVLGKALLAFGGAKVPGAPQSRLARPARYPRNETPLENVIVKFPDP